MTNAVHKKLLSKSGLKMRSLEQAGKNTFGPKIARGVLVENRPAEHRLATRVPPMSA
jgi:hypothetical protein